MEPLWLWIWRVGPNSSDYCRCVIAKMKAHRPTMLRVKPAEALHITERQDAGGYQDFQKFLADQLSDGRLEVFLDDEQLGKLIRLMTQYGSGGFQSHLQLAFRRNLGRMIAGFEQT